MNQTFNPPVAQQFRNQTFNPPVAQQFRNQTFNPPVAQQFMNQTFNPPVAQQFMNQTFNAPLVEQFKNHSTIEWPLFRRSCEPWGLVPETAFPQQQPGAAAYPDVTTCP
jgi:hypothetical protein